MTPHQQIYERLRDLTQDGVKLPAFALDKRIEYQLLRLNSKGEWSGPRVQPGTETIYYDADQYSLVGTTAWCPDHGICLALTADIDGSNHDNKCSDEDTINRLAEKLSTIPCIRVNRSKSGKGLQVWAYGEWSAPTRQHVTALGAAFGDWLSEQIGEQIVIDVAGGNMWLWFDDKARDGFEVISEATAPFTATLSPATVAPAPVELQPTSRDWFDTVCDDPQLREKAISALQSCKCYDSYDDWRNVGMALHSIDPELFESWDNWSRQSSKYREGDTQRQWNSFGPGGISAGTLFHLAKQDGWEWSSPAPEPALESDPAESAWSKIFPISYFDDEPEPRTYSIQDILVEGECCIIGGAMKTLKTSIAMDMAVSLRSGHSFLGKFAVTQPDAEFGALPTVLFMSAESGKQTLHDLRLRICRSKGIDPQSDLARIAFCPIVPKFGNQKMMDVFRQALDELQPSFLFVDPAYIAMPAGVSSSLGDMGVALYEMINTAADRGITFILLAHHKKNQQRRPPTLDDLSGVGYAEAFRQWLLLNRITGYKNDGHHELYMMAGGSAGHDGLYTLHVDEGKRPKEPTDPPRRWEIGKLVLSDDDTDSADRQDYVDKRDAILAAIRDKGPISRTEIATAVKLKSKPDVLDSHLQTLLAMNSIEIIREKRGKAKAESDYYRLTEAYKDAELVCDAISKAPTSV